MAENVIYTDQPVERIREVIASLPARIAGRFQDSSGLARGVALRTAVAFLEKVQIAFLVKAGGGTDDAGIQWAKLSKEYLAYGRRFGKGEQSKLKKGAGLDRKNNRSPGGKDGLLTKAQEQKWWAIYRSQLAWLATEKPITEAKAQAAATAWERIKKDGAKTKLEVYGNRQVEIGRDSGVMFNSLSPGALTENGADASYTPAGNQIVEYRPGALIVGTNVDYAGAFHALRPLWPEEIPDSWVEYALQHAFAAVVEALRDLIGQLSG